MDTQAQNKHVLHMLSFVITSCQAGVYSVCIGNNLFHHCYDKSFKLPSLQCVLGHAFQQKVIHNDNLRLCAIFIGQP